MGVRGLLWPNRIPAKPPLRHLLCQNQLSLASLPQPIDLPVVLNPDLVATSRQTLKANDFRHALGRDILRRIHRLRLQGNDCRVISRCGLIRIAHCGSETACETKGSPMSTPSTLFRIVSEIAHNNKSIMRMIIKKIVINQPLCGLQPNLACCKAFSG